MEILKQPSKVLKMSQEFKCEFEDRITGFLIWWFFIDDINIVFFLQNYPCLYFINAKKATQRPSIKF